MTMKLVYRRRGHLLKAHAKVLYCIDHLLRPHTYLQTFVLSFGHSSNHVTRESLLLQLVFSAIIGKQLHHLLPSFVDRRLHLAIRRYLSLMTDCLAKSSSS